MAEAESRMNFPGDPSTALLAACAGDTVKLFDFSAEAGDPCTLSYTPSPGCAVNSVKWNHTSELFVLQRTVDARYDHRVSVAHGLTKSGFNSRLFVMKAVK